MKTHYDVLKLRKNCSAKEIREAFLNLSKKYHPDKNDNLDAHKKFVEVNEAYKVLSKEHSRRNYDASLHRPQPDYSYYYPRSSHRYSTVEQAREYYRARRESQDFGAGSEQFFSPRKVTIAVICVVVVVINSVFRVREAQNRRDYHGHLAALAFQKTRERNKVLGRDEVLRMMMNRTYRGISMAEVKEDYEKLKRRS